MSFQGLKHQKDGRSFIFLFTWAEFKVQTAVLNFCLVLCFFFFFMSLIVPHPQPVYTHTVLSHSKIQTLNSFNRFDAFLSKFWVMWVQRKSYLQKSVLVFCFLWFLKNDLVVSSSDFEVILENTCKNLIKVRLFDTMTCESEHKQRD